MAFPFYHQPDAMDCGPTCLRIIAKHYGRSISLPKLRQLSETTREGSSLKTISNAAEKIGFKTLGVKVNFEKLVADAPLPCIVHWRQQHFVVVYAIKKKSSFLSSLRGTKQSANNEQIASGCQPTFISNPRNDGRL
ncbi:MAG: hypothetical protein K0B10_15455, partial [Vicingaceae bacterium]|nr:hypothetical protein [Vicingaceae bacterium]